MRIYDYKIFFLIGMFFVLSTPLSSECSCKKIESLFIETALKKSVFKVEVAETPKALKKGLMFRRSLENDAGMLFVFSTPRRACFWMQNTYLSLDLLFIDSYGMILGLVENTIPLSQKRIQSSVNSVKAVLEIPAGTIKKLRLSVGDRVRHRVFKIKVEDNALKPCEEKVSP